MNRQQLLSRLARRGWPVTYSTGPLSVWDRQSDTFRAAPLLPQYRVSDGVSVEHASKVLLRWQRLRSYDRWITRRHAASLRRHVNEPGGDIIAHIFHPAFAEYADALRPRWTVYHAFDLFSEQPCWTDDLAHAEDELLQRADLVVASSASVAAALHRLGRDEVLVLPNGGDARAFEAGTRLPCPADLAAIPRPRIAYIGRVNRKVDFPMIAAMARSQPDWQWVLVGPVAVTGAGAPSLDPKLADAFRDCQNLPNVHFLGNKPHVELPAYAAHMDVNTMCYRADRGWWNAASPLKLNEYLATGRPVVSIDLPDIRSFSDVVTFVRDTGEWRRALAASLDDRSPQAVERRRRVARANSWDKRVDRLEQAFAAMFDGRPVSELPAPAPLRRSRVGREVT